MSHPVPGQVTADTTRTPLRVKVHPHKSKVNSGTEACVSVTPDIPGGHAYYMGTVVMADAAFRIHTSGVARARREQVRNVHAWCVGTLLSEHDTQQGDGFPGPGYTQVTYHYAVGRFMTLDGRDVTDDRFTQAVCRGRDFFVRLSPAP